MPHPGRHTYSRHFMLLSERGRLGLLQHMEWKEAPLRALRLCPPPGCELFKTRRGGTQRDAGGACGELKAEWTRKKKRGRGDVLRAPGRARRTVPGALRSLRRGILRTLLGKGPQSPGKALGPSVPPMALPFGAWLIQAGLQSGPGALQQTEKSIAKVSHGGTPSARSRQKVHTQDLRTS